MLHVPRVNINKNDNKKEQKEVCPGFPVPLWLNLVRFDVAVVHPNLGPRLRGVFALSATLSLQVLDLNRSPRRKKTTDQSK